MMQLTATLHEQRGAVAKLDTAIVANRKETRYGG